MRRIQVKVFHGRNCELHVEHAIGNYISRAEAATIADVSDSTLRRMINADLFPEPVEMTDGSQCFDVADVIDWVGAHYDKAEQKI